MTALSFDIVARNLTGGAFAAVDKSVTGLESDFASATAHVGRFEAAVASAERRTMAGAVAVGRYGGEMRNTAMMSRQLSFQLVDLGQALATAPTMGIYALQNLGFQVAQIGQLYAGQGGFTQAIKDSGAQLGRFALRFGPIAAAAGLAVASIAGLRAEIGKTTDVTVTFGDTALAVWQTVRDGIWTLVKPAADALAPWFAAAWSGILDFTKYGINSMVGLFVGGFGAVKAIWSGLPAAIGDVAIGAANTAINALNLLLQKSAQGVDWLIGLFNKIPGVDIGKIGEIKGLSNIANPFAGAASDLGSAISEAFSGAFGQDFAGAAFEAIRGNTIQNAIALISEDAKGASDKMSALARQALGGLRSLADETNAAVGEAGEMIGRVADYSADRIGQFFDAIEAGKSPLEALRETALSVLRDIGNAMLRSGLTQLFGNLFGGSTLAPLHAGSPLFGASDFGANGFLLPPRAAGGPVQAGMAYLVGERGPEPFIPGTSGTILPNSSLRGGGEPKVIVNNYEAPGTKSEVNQRRGADGSTILDIFSKRVGQDYGLKRPATAT